MPLLPNVSRRNGEISLSLSDCDLYWRFLIVFLFLEQIEKFSTSSGIKLSPCSAILRIMIRKVQIMIFQDTSWCFQVDLAISIVLRSARERKMKSRGWSVHECRWRNFCSKFSVRNFLLDISVWNFSCSSKSLQIWSESILIISIIEIRSKRSQFIALFMTDQNFRLAGRHSDLTTNLEI